MVQPPTADQQATLAELRQSVARVEAGESDSAESISTDSTSTDATSTELTGTNLTSSGQSTGSSAAEMSTPEGDAYTKARAVVLRKLTGSAKSRHQLGNALREREFSEEVIDTVLDRMEQVQLIDDAEFARTWVRTRHELKGLGSAALRRELIDRGVDAEHIQDALAQLSADDEEAAAREMIESKLRGVVIPVGNGPEDRKERDKITRRLVSMLGRRGHHPGAATGLVRDALANRTH